MMRTSRFAGVAAAAGTIASLAVVSPAGAQPSLPEAGNETPGVTIRQLSNPMRCWPTASLALKSFLFLRLSLN